MYCLCTQEQTNRFTAENMDNKEGSETSLRHRMRYTAHSNDPLSVIERYTHSMSSGGPASPGNINVSITWNRQLPTLLTQRPSMSTRDTWRGLTPSPIPNQEREKSHPKLTSGVETSHGSWPASSTSICGAITRAQSRKSATDKGNSVTSAKETKPSQSVKFYTSSHMGPSLAPQGVRAVATWRLRPITSNTMIKGKRLTVVTR